MDVGAWLRGLGLERYEKAFRDNEVDALSLPHLTADDLKEIGVTAIGHRRRLLQAIADLGRQPGQVTPSPAAPSQLEAERRQLTVLFCDLVGSTALSSRLDPEDMREVIRAYQDTCAGVIVRFEGFVAKFMGDGVLAYFGWPRAHEDEAVHATRAGLALVDAVAGLHAPDGAQLDARVGIATGLVVVGDVVGDHATEERMVVGDTPNLAARLQGVAQPGQVVIAAATRRLIGSSFDLTDLGPQTLKGLEEPVAAHGVIGERALPSRFEARSGEVLQPMVGRDHELALLLERWSQAKASEGQGVLLLGEAGIGKSRITRALLDAIAEEPHTRIRYQCSPYHSDSALWPVTQQLSHAAGLTADDPAEAKLDKLEALLAQGGDVAAAPLLADLMSLDSSRYRAQDLTPQAQRARTLEALVGQLLGLAARQPVLVVVEDAHWIDPTTLELIEQGLERIAGARAMILLTSRPDQQPDVAAHPHVTRLTLNRLGRGGVAAIIAELGGDRLPADTVDAIIARTDGVPLFVEEMTKSLVESEHAVDREKSHPASSIPTSLHDSLMARLDRVPEIKEIAQTAAVVGRQFDYAMLVAIAEQSEADLRDALDRLAGAGLVFSRGRPPEATYTFKHALVRDAAYASCLNAKKRELHAKVAAKLQSTPAGQAEPATLAYHYGEAGYVDEAILSWLAAGQRSVAASADTEAVRCFQQGIHLLDGIADRDRREFLELELLTALGAPMIAQKGQKSPQVEEVYSKALDLARHRSDRERLVTILQGLGRVYLMRPDLRQVARTADELESAVTGSEMAAVCRLRAQLAYFAGSFRESRQLATQGVQLADFDREQVQAMSHGMGHGLICMGYLGCNSAILGYPTQAVSEFTDAIEKAEEVAHPYSIAHNVGMMAMFQEITRDVQGARRSGESLLVLADRYGLPQWIRLAEAALAWARSFEENLADGVTMLEAAVLGYRETIGSHGRSFHGALLGESLIRLGDLDRAGREVEEALEFAKRSGVQAWSAELHRLKAQVSLRGARSDQNAAAQSLHRAIEIAQGQQAKLFELRAARDLARLSAERGDRQAALDLLSPVYNWFTEGFDTADLKEAKTLLDELS